MVFQSHNHYYQRTDPINGVIYIVTGGAGAPIYTPINEWFVNNSKKAYHYCVLDVSLETMEITFMAKDVNGNTFDELIIYPFTIPYAPSITGKTSGKTGVEYDYTFVTKDPDDDDIYLYVEWGDDTIEDWIGPYDSGEEVILEHAWSKQGTYIVRAKAKDEYGDESAWGTLSVTMPKSKLYNDRPLLGFLQSILERFPLLSRLLQPVLNRLLNLS
jgi:hypothetical protein